jgi:hypothetical protein
MVDAVSTIGFPRQAAQQIHLKVYVQKAMEERLLSRLTITNVIPLLREEVRIEKPLDIIDKEALSDPSIAAALRKSGVKVTDGALNAAASLYDGQRDIPYELYSLALDLPIRGEILDRISGIVFKELKAYAEMTNTLYRGYNFKTKEELFEYMGRLLVMGEWPKTAGGEISLTVRRLVAERFAQMNIKGFSILLELDASKIDYKPVMFGTDTDVKIGESTRNAAALQYITEAEVRTRYIPLDAIKGGVITFTENGRPQEILLGPGLQPRLE